MRGHFVADDFWSAQSCRPLSLVGLTKSRKCQACFFVSILVQPLIIGLSQVYLLPCYIVSTVYQDLYKPLKQERLDCGEILGGRALSRTSIHKASLQPLNLERE